MAVIILGATLGSLLYVESQLSSQTGSSFGLYLNVTSASEVAYPNGSVGVTVFVTAVGGVPPYTYAAAWADRTNQTSTTGNFTRVFGGNVPVASLLTITAQSANSGIGYLTLTLPSQPPAAVNGQLSTRTLVILPANGLQGGQAGRSSTSTQSKETNTYIAVTNASAPSGSQNSTPPSSSTTTFVSSASTTSLTSTQTSTSQTSTSSQSASSQNWVFVPAFPPSVTVSQNHAYLNVTYTNTSDAPASIYISAVVASSGGPGRHAPGPVLSVGPGGQGGLYLDLGNFASGSYSVTFYAVNNSNAQQISQSETIQFTVQ